jgi:vacuolar-type H+-ATPase subunit H
MSAPTASGDDEIDWLEGLSQTEIDALAEGNDPAPPEVQAEIERELDQARERFLDWLRQEHKMSRLDDAVAKADAVRKDFERDVPEREKEFLEKYRHLKSSERKDAVDEAVAKAESVADGVHMPATTASMHKASFGKGPLPATTASLLARDLRIIKK